MTTPWRIVGSVLAVITFVVTLLNPGHFLTLLTLPPILEAAAAAVCVFVAVWLYDGVFIAARWVWRKLAS